MSLKFAVFGNPISHSKSPQIHFEFARELSVKIDYQAILVDGDFAKSLQKFRANGGVGANITLPFKEQAFKLAGIAHAPALAAGAANTLWWGADNTLIVNNTDGIGLLRDLQDNLNCQVQGKKILILGAGGAAAGIIAPLMYQHPLSIDIANRTFSKAEKLVNNFASLNNDERAVEMQALDFASLENNKANKVYDLIINATSAGLVKNNNIEFNFCAQISHSKTFAYDLIYGINTPLKTWAEKQKIKFADGLGMLIEQAAESFFLWHGLQPNTQKIIKLIKNK